MVESKRELTQLVDDERVRPAIRKLFTGNASQIICELIQNAQRAGAKRVEFTTSINGLRGAMKNMVEVRDDGTGVLNDIDGWHTMLTIADSSYQNENVKMQDPLGLGLHALFACSQVSKVTLRSGGRMIDIDNKRWWDDKSYYSTWAERLITYDQGGEERGLRIEIECEMGFIKEVINALTAKEEDYRRSEALPARGYEGVLDITLNGGAVNTRPLSKFIHHPSGLIWEGEYLGNRLRITHGRYSCVNWFGQAVEETLLDGGFSFYLEVRTGTPLDLKSPTREGVIRNGKREALRQFIIDKIFDAVNGAPAEGMSPEWVSGLYNLNPERANREAKYYVAGKLPNVADMEISSTKCFYQFQQEVKAYDRDDVVLVESGVMVEYKDGEEQRQLANQHGIQTFVEDLRRVYGEPYVLHTGDSERLGIRELVWRPRNITGSMFVEAGVFALRETGAEPQEWHAVIGGVFTFDSGSSYCIENAGPFVAAADRYGWLRSDYPWALFDPEGADDRYETCRGAFEKSITETIMYEFPDTIAEPFSLSDLSDRLGGGRITKIDVDWSEKEQPLLKVINEHGREKKLRVI